MLPGRGLGSRLGIPQKRVEFVARDLTRDLRSSRG